MIFRNVRFEDLRPDKENVPKLADELETFVQGGDAERRDSVLVRFQVSEKSTLVSWVKVPSRLSQHTLPALDHQLH